MSDTEVHLRCYPEEKATLRARARHHELSLSEYLRRLWMVEERETLRSKVYPDKNVSPIGDP